MRFFAFVIMPLCAVIGACQAEPASIVEGDRLDDPILVKVATPKAVREASRFQATGTVRARSETVLSFPTSGRVQSMGFDEGARVDAGTLLARLDPAQVGAATASAEAEVERAKAEYDRQKFLFDRGWVTAPRIQNAETELAAARARLRSAQFDSARSRIAAPVSGTVLVRHVEPNQIVNSGQPIITIAEDARGFVLAVRVSDRNLAQLTIGQPVEVGIPALGPETLNGQIVEIGAQSEAGTGTFEVEIALPPGRDLRSGLVGEASFLLGIQADREPLVKVPSLAIFDARAGEGFVFVEEGGRAKATLVEIARVDGTATLVSSGVSENARIIVSDIERLQTGQAVRTNP
ncbi:MAG: efflux RND transporter periplasmic adaptor subunit [Erythrobacter sp.]|nr:efflux RND transporter periplasmic adaptor subunit [Erythrobacter sp.]